MKVVFISLILKSKKPSNDYSMESYKTNLFSLQLSEGTDFFLLQPPFITELQSLCSVKDLVTVSRHWHSGTESRLLWRPMSLDI